jgi:hypothetical protein
LVVDSETEGAEVEIDGRSVGHTPLDGPVRLNVGSHVVVITAPDRGPFRRKVEVVGGRQQELVVPALAEPDLSPAKALEPASTSAPAPAPLETRRSPVHVRRAAWAMLGVTAALGTAALVTGILTVRAEKRFDDALDEYPGSSGEIDDRSRRARGLAAATDALIGTAVVAASVTIGLAIAARKTTKRRRAAASIVGGTGLRVRF